MISLQSSGPFVLVDDDELDIELMRRCYEKSVLTNEFLPFSSGRSFLDYMNAVREGRAELPAFVLLDLNMPFMDGFTVLERLAEDDSLYGLPFVVFLSDTDRPSDIRRSHKLASAFQEKFERVSDCVAYLNGLRPHDPIEADPQTAS